MISPVQRIPQTDKTIMPLRGEGNQPLKPPHIINVEIKGGGPIPQYQVKELIKMIKESISHND